MYKEVTSSVTSKVSGGSKGSLRSLFKKSVVSRMFDGSEVANGCRNQSTNHEMFSVGALLEDTVDLPGLPGLCILGKR